MLFFNFFVVLVVIGEICGKILLLSVDYYFVMWKFLISVIIYCCLGLVGWYGFKYVIRNNVWF